MLRGSTLTEVSLSRTEAGVDHRFVPKNFRVFICVEGNSMYGFARVVVDVGKSEYKGSSLHDAVA